MWSGDSVSGEVPTVAGRESAESAESAVLGAEELSDTSKEPSDEDGASEGDSECHFALCSLRLLDSCGDAERAEDLGGC